MLSSNPTVPSCKKCFGIVQNLNDHISNDHSTSVHSSHIAYLNNIILNLLSLITNSSSGKTDKDKLEPATSSPSEIQESNSIVTNSVPLDVDNSQTVPTSVISKNLKGESESSFKQKQKQKEEEFLKSYHAQGGLNISGPSELTPKMAFQPDIINEFLTESLDSDQYVHTLDKNKPKTSKQNKLEHVDISQLIGTSTDDLNTVSTALLTPDGNLTPAGLSLLLANQQKNINSSGKSDLDVADILVNKMPIQSLNKGLDPSLLHLSQLYLQQWALNQQTQALVDANSSNIAPGNPLKKEKQNLKPELKQQSLQQQPKPQQQMQQLQSQQQPQLPQKQQTQLQKLQNKYFFSEIPSVNDPNIISLQQLIAQHKKISGQIESLNSKEKKAPEDTDKNSSSQASQANYVFGPLSQSFVGENSIIAISPTQQQSSLEQLNNNQSSLPVSLMPVTQGVYSKPPEKHITNSRETAITNLGDSEQKNDISANNNNNSNNDSNKVSAYLDGETVNEDNIEFVRHEVIPLVNNSNPNKTALYALQNLVIQGPVQSGNEEKPGNSNDTETNRKRKFSAITMVPISQYDTLRTDSDSVSQPKESKVLHSCNVCGVTFTVLSTLEAHMKTHSNEKIEECMYCHQSFSDNDEYFKHIASHCGEENIIRCPHCPKIFTSKGDYTKHVTSHTQNRPYQCSHCKKSFKDPGSLIKHERIHTGEQPYVCEICKRGFAEKSSLCKHMRTHSGEKPYKCDQCDKSFSISGNLHRHLFIHTGQRPFKCTICSKAFNNASHLKRHIKNIHQKESNKNVPELGNGGLVIPRQNESHLIAVSTHNVITAISEI